MEIENDEKTGKKGLLKIIKKKEIWLIALPVFLIISFLFCYYKTMVSTDWHFFNSNRIAFIENKFMISLDDTKPKRYWEPKLFMEHPESAFTFKVDDYKKFMEGFRGKEILNSYESPDGSSAYYKCRADERLCFNLNFTKDGNVYEGKLESYIYYEKSDFQTTTSEYTTCRKYAQKTTR